MKKLKLRKQQTKIDCGPACLTMIAEYYGYNTSISEFSDLVNLNSNGCSMYDLSGACDKINLECDAYNATIDEILEARSKKEITFPIVCHIVSEENMLHYVVVKDIGNKKVTVYDPGPGERILDIKDFAKMFTGNFMDIKPGQDFKKKKRNSKTISLVKECIKENKKTIIPIYVFAFIALGIELLGTLVYPIIVDYVEKMEWMVAKFSFKGYEMQITLLDVAMILIICYVFGTLVGYIKGKLNIKVAYFMDKKLTERYYNHSLKIGMDKYKRISSGDMIARGEETTGITSVFTDALVTIIVDSVVALVVFTMLMNISVKLLMCLLVTVVLYIGILVYYKDKIKATNEDIMRCNSKQISGYKEAIDSIKQVKARRNEDYFSGKLKALIKETMDCRLKNGKVMLKQSQIFGFVSLVSGVLLLVFGAAEIRNGRLSLGTLLMFNAMTSAFINPLLNILGLQTSFKATEAAIDRLDSIFYYDENAYEEGSKEIKGDIEVKNLSYGYDDNKLLFENANISFKQGKSYGIVGKSGTGKSTFADLLVGLYKPNNGEITIDGTDVSQIPKECFSSDIALVTQESYFYSDSIKDNLCEGKEFDEAHFREVAEACKVSEFVDELPMGYDTTMNEGGSGFSSGQKQRLAIAKALLTNPKVLILDEATSNLDYDSECSIMDYVLSMGTTLICIAHRNHLIDMCDEAYVLEGGQILKQR